MADPPNGAAPLLEVEYHYIKSNYFRVIYVEGAYGGINPRGQVYFSVFNERNAIPRRSTVKLEPGAAKNEFKVAAPEKVIDTRGGVVREVEAEIVMTLDSARVFHRWLGEHLERAAGKSKT
jgi:hypothetical protein